MVPPLLSVSRMLGAVRPIFPDSAATTAFSMADFRFLHLGRIQSSSQHGLKPILLTFAVGKALGEKEEGRRRG